MMSSYLLDCSAYKNVISIAFARTSRVYNSPHKRMPLRWCIAFGGMFILQNYVYKLYRVGCNGYSSAIENVFYSVKARLIEILWAARTEIRPALLSVWYGDSLNNNWNPRYIIVTALRTGYRSSEYHEVREAVFVDCRFHRGVYYIMDSQEQLKLSESYLGVIG